MRFLVISRKAGRRGNTLLQKRFLCRTLNRETDRLLYDKESEGALMLDHMATEQAVDLTRRKFITYMMALRKGGVGKTTMTINIGVFLASLGFAVGILDGDIQQNASELRIHRDQQTGA